MSLTQQWLKFLTWPGNEQIQLWCVISGLLFLSSLLSVIPESKLTTENKLCILRIQIKVNSQVFTIKIKLLVQNIRNWITVKEFKKAESFLESIWDRKDSLMTLLENRRLPEYQLEESVQALIDLCGCKFQIGYCLSNQVRIQILIILLSVILRFHVKKHAELPELWFFIPLLSLTSRWTFHVNSVSRYCLLWLQIWNAPILK